jgi:hypothetical protein
MLMKATGGSTGIGDSAMRRAIDAVGEGGAEGSVVSGLKCPSSASAWLSPGVDSVTTAWIAGADETRTMAPMPAIATPRTDRRIRLRSVPSWTRPPRGLDPRRRRGLSAIGAVPGWAAI